MEITILDCGSGTFQKFHHFLTKENALHFDIDRTGFHIELIADIHYLPFRNEMFPIVHASHILEHLDNPLQAISELKRVSESIVIIKVPNSAFYKYHTEGTKNHVFSWNYYTLNNLLKRFFGNVEIIKTKRFSTEIKTYNRLKRTFYYLKWFFWHFLNPYMELTAICRKQTKRENIHA